MDLIKYLALSETFRVSVSVILILLLIPVLSQKKVIHFVTTLSSKIYFSIILSLTPKFSM